MASGTIKRIELGTPRLDELKTGTLRAVDFAWQAFQAGRSYERHGRTSAGVDVKDADHEAFVAWWNDHPQVDPSHG